jgi:hypothetical protein
MFALLLTGPLGAGLIDVAAPRLLRTEEKHVLRRNSAEACESHASAAGMLTYADVCCGILTYADVC